MSRMLGILTAALAALLLTGCCESASPPGSDAGLDQEVASGATFTLTGIATADPAAGGFTTSWAQTGGTSVLTAAATSTTVTLTAPTVTEDTVLTFDFTVAYPCNRWTIDSVTITVKKPAVTFGLVPTDPNELALIPRPFSNAADGLPLQKVLSNGLPPIADQGGLGSCVAFAAGHAAATYALNSTTGGDASSSNNWGSAAYLYDKLLRELGSPCGEGTLTSSALNILVREGIPSAALVPYSEQCFVVPPPDTGRETFRIGSFKLLQINRDALRRELSEGRIIVFGGDTYTDFSDVRGSDVYRGNGQVNPRGGHAMAAIGYDDERAAFRIQNSWGTGWGDAGYFWMAYTTFEATMSEAFSVTPRNAPGPDDGSRTDPNVTSPTETTVCNEGSSPAANAPWVCCPNGSPYYSSDGYCYDTPQQDDGACGDGYRPAINNPTVCCPDAFPYDGGDGLCYDQLQQDDDRCTAGFSPALNYPSVCCPDGFQYFGGDGFCYADNPSSTCGVGYQPAVNNPQVCCPSGYPYDAGDGFCSDQPVVSDTCSNGYSPAINDASVCCPTGYPYFGADGFCHDSDPTLNATCSPGFAPAANAPWVCCPDGYPYFGGDGFCYASPMQKGSHSKAARIEHERREPANAPSSVRKHSSNARLLTPLYRAAPVGGRVATLRLRQEARESDAGALEVLLIADVILPSPLDMQRVALVDPSGATIEQDYHVAFANGYVFFARTDARQWLSGRYTVRFEGLNAKGEFASFTGAADLGPLGAVAPEWTPDGKSPAKLAELPAASPAADAVLGDNEKPARVKDATE